MDAMIQLQKIRKGNDEKVLIFDGYIPNYDHNRSCTFIFNGSRICYTNSSITEIAKSHLAEILKEEFGEPPYDYRKKKKQFGSGRIYTLEFC